LLRLQILKKQQNQTDEPFKKQIHQQLSVDTLPWARVQLSKQQKPTEVPLSLQMYLQTTDTPLENGGGAEVKPEVKAKHPKRGRHFHRLECDCATDGDDNDTSEYESCNDDNCPYHDSEEEEAAKYPKPRLSDMRGPLTDSMLKLCDIAHEEWAEASAEAAQAAATKQLNELSLNNTSV
jgi:hypothetical protein